MSLEPAAGEDRDPPRRSTPACAVGGACKGFPASLAGLTLGIKLTPLYKVGFGKCHQLHRLETVDVVPRLGRPAGDIGEVAQEVRAWPLR